MAIAFDNLTKAGAGGSTATLTVSHTTSGANRLLVVGVHTAAANNTVTSASYNGVALTSIGGINGNTRRTELWYLINPASGANTVSVTCGGVLTQWSFTAASYTGVSQATPLDVSATANIVVTTMTTTATTTFDNDWLIATGASQTPVVGSGTTQRGTTNTQVDGLMIVDSNGPKTPTGSYSLIITDVAGPGNDGMIMGAFRSQNSVTLPIGQGSYVYTGYSIILSVGRRILITTGNYTLTGFATLLTVLQKWVVQAKNSSVMSNGTKSTSVWTDQSKNSSTPTNQIKN